MVADLAIGTGRLPFEGYTLTAQTLVTTAGNTVEFTLAAVLMRRWLGRPNHLERPVDVGLLFVALGIGTAVSAVTGSLALVRWSGLHWSDFPDSVRTWWLGDTSGGMLVAPLLIAWGLPPWRLDLSPQRAARAVAILAAVAGVSIAVFSSHHPLTYAVFPVLIVAAVYLGQRGATVALLLTFGVAVAMTAGNVGPFVQKSIDDEALNTQLYILVATLATLTLGGAVSARRRAAVELAESQRREAERAGEERQRIARDLHDSVSQTLFSLGLHAEIAKHEVERANVEPDAPLPTAIAAVSELAQGALLEMRASIFDLRGSALADQGLVAALRAHGAALAVRHAVQVTIDGPSERLPLATETEELVFRIGQEAVTNAVKHSGGQDVSVEIEVAGPDVHMRIRDEGSGFDPSASYAGHLGLELMRSRAADAGGSIAIDSAPGEGTTVHVVVPAVATVGRPAPPAPQAVRPASVS